MATEIKLTSEAGTNAPYKLGSPPDFGTLYSGRALEFDGVSDYVENASFTGHQSSVGTMSCWAKIGTIAGSGYHMLMGVGGDSTAYRERNITIDISGGPYLGVTCHSSNPRTSFVLTTGRWYHFVMTWNGGTSKIYADGVFREYTTSQTDLLTPSGTKVRLGSASYSLASYFDGQISNAQVWDKEWSLLDVQYAYTHPENLITDNSAVTSGTTISNLKAWYPCTEGNPRSPQTTVYDGSPKELGSDLVTDGDMELAGTDNWGTEANLTVSKDTSVYYAGSQSLKLVNTTGSKGSTQTISATVSGAVYKITGYYKSTGNARVYIGDGSSYSSLSPVGDWTAFSVYIAPASGTQLILMNYGGAGTSYWDNVVAKQVQMGNHGTTTFYGDMNDLLSTDQDAALDDALDATDDTFVFETGSATLIKTNGFVTHSAPRLATFDCASDIGKLTNDIVAGTEMISNTANNREFTNGTTTDWVEFYGAPAGTVAVDNARDNLLCTINGVSTQGGCKLDLSTYGTGGTVVGRTYTISVNALCDDSSNIFRIGMGGTSDEQDQIITGSSQVYTYTFVCTTASTDLVFFFTNCDYGTILTLDDISMKEIPQGIVTLPFETIVDSSYNAQFDITGGTSNLNVSLASTDGIYDVNGAHIDNATTGTNQVLTSNFVATGTTSYLALQLKSTTDDQYCDIDNLKIHEVGVATGWTTADAEPLIPQTALMGMSKPMLFDGYDDYVDCGNLNVVYKTYSCWVDYTSSTTGFVLSHTYNDGGNRFGFEVFASKVRGQFYHAASSGYRNVDHTITLSNVGLTHLVWTWDGADPDTGKMYINGAEVGTNASGGSLNSTYKLLIGARSDGSTFGFGLIDEVSTFTTELSLAQVQEIFNDGVPFDLDGSTLTGSPTLVNYWRNTGASTWTDLEGSDNGTPAGSPSTILLPEGTTSGKDILGFPLTHTNNGWLNLSGSEYVKASKSSVFDFGTGSLSFDMWVKGDGNPSADTFPLYIGTSATGRISIYTGTSGSMELALDEGTQEVKCETSATDWNDGDWHYLACVVNRDNATPFLQVFQDDKLVAQENDFGSFTSVMTLDCSNGDVVIGLHGESDTPKYNGTVDEVRIYNRVLVDVVDGGLASPSDTKNLTVSTTGEILKNYKHGLSKHS